MKARAIIVYAFLFNNDDTDIFSFVMYRNL